MRFAYFTITYPSVLFKCAPWPFGFCIMPVEKCVLEPLRSTCSLIGLRPWYFPQAAFLPRRGLPIFLSPTDPQFSPVRAVVTEPNITCQNKNKERRQTDNEWMDVKGLNWSQKSRRSSQKKSREGGGGWGGERLWMPREPRGTRLTEENRDDRKLLGLLSWVVGGGCYFYHKPAPPPSSLQSHQSLPSWHLSSPFHFSSQLVFVSFTQRLHYTPISGLNALSFLFELLCNGEPGSWFHTFSRVSNKIFQVFITYSLNIY